MWICSQKHAQCQSFRLFLKFKSWRTVIGEKRYLELVRTVDQNWCTTTWHRSINCTTTIQDFFHTLSPILVVKNNDRGKSKSMGSPHPSPSTRQGRTPKINRISQREIKTRLTLINSLVVVVVFSIILFCLSTFLAI